MSEFDATDPQAGGNPSDDQQPSVEQLVEENKRLNSRLVTSENANRQAQQVVDISRQIYAAPGGKEIFARAQKAKESGKELSFTAKQEEKLPQNGQVVQAKSTEEPTPSERSAAAAEMQVKLHRRRFWVSLIATLVALGSLILAINRDWF